MPENLDWEDVINAMMAAHGERGGKHARTTLENMLSSSDEDMLNKIADAIEHIGQRVCFILALVYMCYEGAVTNFRFSLFASCSLYPL